MMTKQEHGEYIASFFDPALDRPSETETFSMTEDKIVAYSVEHKADLIGPRALATYIRIREQISSIGVDAITAAQKKHMDFIHSSAFVCNPRYANCRFRCFYVGEPQYGLYRDEFAVRFVNTDIEYTRAPSNPTVDVDVYEVYRSNPGVYKDYKALEDIMEPILRKVIPLIPEIPHAAKTYKAPTLEDLINNLRELDARYTDISPSEEDGCRYYPNDPTGLTLASITEGMACELLISGSSCNWANAKKLEKAGFSVYRGDGDSFGWLTGCIESKQTHNILVYG